MYNFLFYKIFGKKHNNLHYVLERYKYILGKQWVII